MATILRVFMFLLFAAVTLTTAQGPRRTGNVTFYSTTGAGYCGGDVNAKTQEVAAVSSKESGNLCGQCVQLSYMGKKLLVPVKDKCPSCALNRIQLSEASFKKLSNLDAGLLRRATWNLVSC